MPEIEILENKDLPRPANDTLATIRVRLHVDRNLWARWCLVLSAEYGKPIEGFDAQKTHIEGPNPFRVPASALHLVQPGPYRMGRIPSFSEAMESNRSSGYSLWAIRPGDGVDVEFELRREPLR